MGCGCNSGGSQMGGGGDDVPKFGHSHYIIDGGGGTRRRKHTRRSRRSGTRKMRGHGRKRACICPGGCKRSTCPCCTGKRFCCTKRCRGCKCKC